MGIFEEIGKSLTDAKDTVVKQTKVLSDLAHLNSMISDNEKKAKKLYQQVGESYYEKHKDDFNAENKETLDDITGILETIEDYKEQIRQLKAMTKCPNCGEELAEDAQFCKKCGAKLDHVPPHQEIHVCSNGHQVSDDEEFCSVCGEKITE